MIEFISVSLRNFMSYGNVPTVVHLNNKGTTLVQGEDLDNTEHGQGANGVGKSSFVQAVIYALYDKVTSNISKDDLVNNINKKNLEVEVIFNKNSNIYSVRRCRKMKSGGDGNFVQILKDGNDITPAGNTNANDEIVNIIGIPYELFVRVVTFTTRQQSFLSLPSRSSSGPNQTDLIEELFQLKLLSQKAEVLKEQIRENEQKLKIEKEKYDLISNEYERLKDQHSSMSTKYNKWEESKELSIKALEEKINEYEVIDYSTEKENLSSIELINTTIKSLNQSITSKRQLINTIKKDIGVLISKSNKWESDRNTSINNITEKLKSINEIDFDTQRFLLEEKQVLTQSTLEIKTQIKDWASKQTEKLKIKNQVVHELEHLNNDKCPYCLQHLEDSRQKKQICEQVLSDTNTELEEIGNQIIQLQSALLSEESYINEINRNVCFKSIVELNNTLNTLENYEAEWNKLTSSINPYDVADSSEEKLLSLEYEINSLNDEIVQHNNQLSTLTSKFQSLEQLLEHKNSVYNSTNKLKDIIGSVNPFAESLSDLTQAFVEFIIPNSEKIDELDTVVEHQKFLYKLLTKKDSFVRKNLLNKSIPFLNKQLAKYLVDLGLPHTVEFTHDMSAKIFQFGRELSFGNLSGGQEARVNIALSLAFRDVLQSMHDTINICMFDEVLDVGLDAIGVQLAAKLLKKKSRDENLATFIISHRDEIHSTFDRKLNVQFTKGFSYISEQDDL